VCSPSFGTPERIEPPRLPSANTGKETKPFSAALRSFSCALKAA
jgi:hypothetical protein